jgi:hypothetical protein
MLRSFGWASRNARDHEARVLAARFAAGSAGGGRPHRSERSSRGRHRRRRAEVSAPVPGLPETTVERRDRIERAMRLALNAELRRLEIRLPFLASLTSAAPFIGLFGTVWGDHRQLFRDRSREQHEYRDGGAGHRRGIVRHRNGARRRDPSGRRLQQDNRRYRALCRPHAGLDRAVHHAAFRCSVEEPR